MNEVLWKQVFPQIYQKIRQIPLARNLPAAQWMFLALEQGLLNSSKYIQWASQYYGLAVLSDSFFQGTFNSTFYHKYKDQHLWGPQAFPVFEWDQVVFVACLDPYSVPSDLEKVYRPILTSYEGLIMGWKQIASSPPIVAPPMAIKTQQELKFEKRPNPNATEQEDNPPPFNNDSFSTAEDAPLTQEFINEHLNLNGNLPQSLNSMPIPPQTDVQPSSQNGNLFELIDTPAIDDVPTDHENNGNSVSRNEEHAPLEMPEGLNFNISPSTNDTNEPTIENLILNKNQVKPNSEPILPVKVPLSPPKQNPTPETKPIVESIRQVPTPLIELEDELKLSFAKAYQSYRNLMVLKINGDDLIPFRWDTSYKSPKNLEVITLNQPSIFRITSRTQKPFHGPISINTINQRFLNGWFGGHNPTCMTLVPLFFQGECVGILLGAADEILDRKESIHLLESTARNVEQNFGTILAS